MTAGGLVIEALTVRFGGVTAVDQVSLAAPGATVTGLIGPNGAGKSTTFNACAGTVAVAAGRIRLGGRALDGLSPSARACAGLGRTFQRMELLDSLTVEENVSIGPEAFAAGQRPWGQLGATRRQRADARDRARSAMDRCGIGHLGARRVGTCSTGERRLVELARAVATPFQFLLLDEPSSGLDPHETEGFARILEGVVAERGTGILLVEHDMALVRAVCDQAYVLDFGRLIIGGPTAEVLASDLVRAAYLGAQEVA